MSNSDFLLQVVVLLFAFQFKHLIADFFLQTKYMLGKFNKSGWFTPLFAHVTMHGVCTYIVLTLFGVSGGHAIILALMDMMIHFVIDKVKVEATRIYTPKDRQFWQWIGFDQFAHHITHYMLIAYALQSLGMI